MSLTLEEIKKQIDLNKKSLDLSSCEISNKDIILICSYLRDNSFITTLSLSNSNIGDEGAKVLGLNTKLKSLDLRFNNISSTGAKAISLIPTLYKLDLGFNNIGIEGVKALTLNTTLKDLDISGNNIGNEGAKVLSSSSTLRILNIRCNNIRVKGAKSLALNTSLVSLDASGNDIGIEGVEALVSSSKLTMLNVRYNRIGDQYSKSFICALERNTTLLKYFHEFHDEYIREKINKTLTRNRILPWLRTIINARLLAQATRSEDCLIGRLPVELLGLINDYAVGGTNHFSFFINQFYKRPSMQDFVDLKKISLT